MTAIVDARGLFAVYPGEDGGIAALQGLTLQVEEGEICVVLGPSGSGKTTLLRVLAGFERPSVGSVVVDGLDLSRASAARLDGYRRRTLGYTDQHYWQALADELTAEQLVGLPLGLARVSPARSGSAGRTSCSSALGCSTERRHTPVSCPVASSSASRSVPPSRRRPRLLLADEPTGELDAVTAAEVLRACSRRSSRSRARRAVVVSHDAASTAHRRPRRPHPRRPRQRATRPARRVGRRRHRWVVAGARGDPPRRRDRRSRARRPRGDGHVELRADGRLGTAGREADRVAGRDRAVRSSRLAAVTRRYGSETALDELDGIVRARYARPSSPGPSGSGKSTLLALLAGLDVPDEGEVSSTGWPSPRSTERAGPHSVASTWPSSARRPSCRDSSPPVRTSSSGSVSAASQERRHAAGRRHARSRRARTARRTGPRAPCRRASASASALARAFATRPAIVIADEPTARLDAATTVVVGTLLRDLAHERGRDGRLRDPRPAPDRPRRRRVAARRSVTLPAGTSAWACRRGERST